MVPDALYINIVRDGRDVVASAMKRWGAELDIKYILRKARYVPVSDILYYGVRYASHRLRKLLSANNALPTWGPLYDGMKEDVINHSLEEICALQWVNCVDKSTVALAALPSKQVYTVKYETFIKDPESSLLKLSDFIGCSVRAEQIKNAVADVRDQANRAGNMPVEMDTRVAEKLRSMNERLGYQW